VTSLFDKFIFSEQKFKGKTKGARANLGARANQKSKPTSTPKGGVFGQKKARQNQPENTGLTVTQN